MIFLFPTCIFLIVPWYSIKDDKGRDDQCHKEHGAHQQEQQPAVLGKDGQGNRNFPQLRPYHACIRQLTLDNARFQNTFTSD